MDSAYRSATLNKFLRVNLSRGVHSGGGVWGLSPPLGSVKSMVSRWVFQVPTGAGTTLESKTRFSLPPLYVQSMPSNINYPYHFYFLIFNSY